MITVAPAHGNLRHTALALLHTRIPPGERETQLAAMLEFVQSGELSLDDLLLAELDGSPVGALLVVRQPGRMAFVWPPVVVSAPDRHDEVADVLLQAAAQRLDGQDILFSQCILEIGDAQNRSSLARNGFGHAADLLFLRRPLDIPLPPQQAVLDSLAFEEGLRDRFAQVADRTYAGSMDCPVLKGVRSARETLEAHQAAGNFDPAQWRIYQSRGVDVGVLLMSEDPDEDAWEALYLGIVPEARGRGFGRAMLLDGLEQARRAGTEAMCITVDSKNTYAVSIYEELSFSPAVLRAVHLRIGGGR